MIVANIIEEGRWGGPQKRISLVARALKKYDIETIVLLPASNSNRFRKALDDSEISWNALPLHRLGRGWFTITKYVATFLPDLYSIWRHLRSEDYALLHVSGGAWQIKGPIAGWLAGVPVIWHLNDTQMPRTIVLLFNILSLLAKAFFVTADRVQKYYLYKGFFRSKMIFSIQAPVDTEKYNKRRVRNMALENNFHSLKVVSVANVNPTKGLETLISAIALAKEKIGKLHLYIVGGIYNSQRSYFESLNRLSEAKGIKQDITFLGVQEDIPSILASCDIYVCSSVAESGPMSVWEAMAMECPIVSTDVGDVAKYIKNGKNGFIVPVGDATEMANAICKLANDELLRCEFGTRSRQVAFSELDVNVIAEKTAIAYAAVLSPRS